MMKRTLERRELFLENYAQNDISDTHKQKDTEDNLKY